MAAGGRPAAFPYGSRYAVEPPDKMMATEKAVSMQELAHGLLLGVRACPDGLVRDYSFTPPTATPAMMYLLKQKYTTISGSAVSVRPR